jgi:hypothetical protein
MQQEEGRVEANNEQIEESLMTLRKHIYKFVTNPLFESQGVLDLEQGRKAVRDLDRIIELSESIRKSISRQPVVPGSIKSNAGLPRLPTNAFAAALLTAWLRWKKRSMNTW